MTSIKKLTQEWANEKRISGSWKKLTTERANCWGRYFARILRNTHKVTSIKKINRKILNKYLENYSNRCSLHSINNQKRLIKSFFSWCVEKNIILCSPVNHWRYASLAKRYAYTLTREQVITILKLDYITPIEKEIKMVIELMYASGIRRSELIDLNLTDIDFSKNTLFIKNGKGDKPRMLPLIPTTKRQLKNYLQNIRLKLAKNEETSLFVGQKGSRLHQAVLQRHIAKIAKKAKIHFSCHALRRTCATHLLENNVNVVYIGKLLGHEKLETTQKYLNITSNYLEASYVKHPRDSIDI